MYRIGDISTGIKVKPLPSKGPVFLPPILFLEHPTALIIVTLVKKSALTVTADTKPTGTATLSNSTIIYAMIIWVVKSSRGGHKISRIIGQKSTQSKEFWALFDTWALLPIDEIQYFL